MSNDGKWVRTYYIYHIIRTTQQYSNLDMWWTLPLFSSQFAHSVLPEDELRNHETCTSTGIMLSQVKSSLPQALNSERYPKWKIQQVCMWSRICCVWHDCCVFPLYCHRPGFERFHFSYSCLTPFVIGFFPEIQRLSSLRPWQQGGLKRQHLCLQSREYEEKFRVKYKWPLFRKGNHKVFSCTMLVYFRVWDAGNVLMIADSTTPTSACAMMELTVALQRLGGTSLPTRSTLWWSRLLMFQRATDGSPATTSRSLKRRL